MDAQSADERRYRLRRSRQKVTQLQKENKPKLERKKNPKNKKTKQKKSSKKTFILHVPASNQ